MIGIETKGFEILKEGTRNDFEKLWGEYSKKIEKKLKNTESVKIHIKEYSPGGKTKFSIKAAVSYAGKSIKAEADD